MYYLDKKINLPEKGSLENIMFFPKISLKALSILVLGILLIYKKI